ncbi:hypothetical protein BH11PLA1_BH11PLA1_22300 [soil metagenome]
MRSNLPGGVMVVVMAAGLMVSVGARAEAQAPQLVKDLGVFPIVQPTVGTASAPLFSLGSTLYFRGRDAGGDVLAATDGTTATTRYVYDFAPGTTNKQITGAAVLAPDRVVITVNVGGVFVTDGTAAGTHRLAALAGGSVIGVQQGLAMIQSGAALWRSDGTEAGTFMVAPDIAVVQAMQVFQGRLFVGGSANSAPRQLHVVDLNTPNTSTPTVLGAATANDLNITGFAELNGVLYYAADIAFNNREMFRTDGTAGGTGVAFELNPSGNGVTWDPVAVGGRLYFGGMRNAAEGAELFSSDGTPAGTTLVADIWVGGGSEPRALVAFDNRVYFSAYTPANGSELYVSDGTAAGTVIVTETFAGDNGPAAQEILPLHTAETPRTFAVISASTNPATFFIKGTTAVPGPAVTTLFEHQGAFYGAETVDGVTQLTRFEGVPVVRTVLSLPPLVSTSSADVTMVSESNGKVYFSPNMPGLGVEPWVSDGTAVGTVLLADIVSGSGGSAPQRFTPAGTRTVFTAQTSGASTRVLYATDGTAAGTALLPGPRVFAGMFASLGPIVLFRAANQNNLIYRTDGTAAGTVALAGQPTWSAGGDSQVAVLNGKAVFAAGTSATGNEPYVCDGATVTLLKDIAAGTASSNCDKFVRVGARVVFAGPGGLWSTDLTPAGTQLIKSGITVKTMLPEGVSGDVLYFWVFNALWRTDGTAAGTTLVSSVPNGADSFARVNGGMTFLSIGGRNVWFTDGTAGGTIVLHTLPAGQTATTAALTSAGGRAFFNGYDAEHGRELWVTGGTLSGTMLHTDIYVPQIPGGVPSSNPGTFAVVGNRLYFGALTELGRELWALDLAAPAARCQPADIADDAGNPLPSSGPNSGVNEGDYNAFFNTFFAMQQVGSPADIADDAGNPLPPFGPGGTPNSGVNEGDYNCFFNTFFSGCP